MSELFDDLMAVQKELPKVHKSATNSHFGNKYVPLEALLDIVVPILNKHNFILLQKPTYLAGFGPALDYGLLHSSGDIVGGCMPLMMAKDDPQAQGSGITYARRYSLTALLGISADPDDDGEAATAPRAPQGQQRPTPPAFKKPSYDDEPPKPVSAPSCPEHGACNLVKAGTSKASGKPYGAFWSCPDRDCQAGFRGKRWSMDDGEWRTQQMLEQPSGLTQEDMDAGLPFE